MDCHIFIELCKYFPSKSHYEQNSTYESAEARGVSEMNKLDIKLPFFFYNLSPLFIISLFDRTER